MLVLAEHSIEVLADIRFAPYGRFGFNKASLEQTCADVGIEYVHIKALGNAAYKKAGPVKLVDPIAGRDEILSLMEGDRRVAMMCACRRYESCHRQDAAQLFPEFEIAHIP